jgi:predicted acylesterase/phospholipase RssA
METIVISGGGTKGFGMLGILQKLYERNILKQIQNFIGSSVGGVLAFFLSCGESPMSIFLRSASKLPINVQTVHNAVLSTIESFLIERFNNKNITFLELFEINKNLLVITSYDVGRQIEMYYSYKESPNYKVIDAIQDTTRVPFLLGGGKLDGCFCSTFPIRYCKLHDLKNIVGIYTIGKYVSIANVRNIVDDLFSLICQLLNKNTILERELGTENDILIELKTEVEALSFIASKDEAVNWFLEGYKQQIITNDYII